VTEKHFILATAGHVDHGKSALVKALTGTDPDRLPEEKARKITIDLGFAHLELAAPDNPDVRFNVGLIDVPGHEDFVKNMVAGVGSIDLALLVVAADDGWMAQTEEHLEILTYLGVRRMVVALTKIDLAPSNEDNESEVRRHLRESPFAKAAIVTTSVVTGRGLDELKRALSREFSSLEPSPDIGKPRLFVDRAFSLHGVGTVVTGTVSGGRFARGDSLRIQPRGRTSKLRQLQSHNRGVESVGPGMRAAFNLSDVTVDMKDANHVRRGDVVTRSGSGTPSRTVDILFLHSPRGENSLRTAKDGTRVRVHYGSGNFAARLFRQAPKGEGSTILGQLRFDAPVFLFAGDHLVIRDSSARRTVAGATVLDPDAPRSRSGGQDQLLLARASCPNDVAVFVSTQIGRDHFAIVSSLLSQSRFSSIEIADAVNRFVKSGEMVTTGEIVIDAGWWDELKAQAARFIDREHEMHPEQTGVPHARLKTQFGMLPMSQLFEALLADLSHREFVRAGDLIRRATHRPVLPERLKTAVFRIQSALANSSTPPSPSELTPDPVSQHALRFLRDTGSVVELNGEVVLARDQFGKMRDAVVAFLRKNNSAATSELRQLLGSNRRVIIPFLERLDREGVTRRIADKRVLAKPS